MTKISDGASLRKRRILDLLAFIKANNPDGTGTGEIQSFMLIKFGLKNETVSKMLQELHVGGWIRCDARAKWYITQKIERAAGWLYDSE